MRSSEIKQRKRYRALWLYNVCLGSKTHSALPHSAAQQSLQYVLQVMCSSTSALPAGAAAASTPLGTERAGALNYTLILPQSLHHKKDLGVCSFLFIRKHKWPTERKGGRRRLTSASVSASEFPLAGTRRAPHQARATRGQSGRASEITSN